MRGELTLQTTFIGDPGKIKANIAYQTYSRELNNRLGSKIQSD